MSELIDVEELKTQFKDYLEKYAQNALDILIEHLEKKNIQKKLVKKINKNIDIPMIGEGTERKVFDAIYETMVSAIKEIEIDSDDEAKPAIELVVEEKSVDTEADTVVELDTETVDEPVTEPTAVEEKKE
tara:strand:- start:219 stop:608 length:390 start_codon:yes stop_codon:yes gene_type:complete